jgi:putative membrane protein
MKDPHRTDVAQASAPARQPADPTPAATPGTARDASKTAAGFHGRLGAWGTFKAPPPPAKSAADLATTLAVNRTLMGADRSLMAWIRTALSMVSFGFTIYKILEGFVAGGANLGTAGQPRAVGLFLIGAGTASILLGILEYWQRASELSAYEPVPIWRPSFVMALAIALFSVALLFAVVLRAL